MSSRRKLKKQITTAISEMYADCIFYKVYVINADRKAARKIILNMVEVHDDFLGRITVRQDKGVKASLKPYFKELRRDFEEQVTAMRKEFDKLPR